MKDWKVTKNKDTKYSWDNDLKVKRLRVVDYTQIYDKPTWKVYETGRSPNTLDKEFKSESQALTYAKRYMRTH